MFESGRAHPSTMYTCIDNHISLCYLRLLVAQAGGVTGAGLSEVVFTGAGNASNVEVTLTDDLSEATFEDAMVVLT